MNRQSPVLHLEVTAQGPGGWPVPSLMHSNLMPQRVRVWVIPDSSGWHSLGTAENPKGVLCQSWGSVVWSKGFLVTDLYHSLTASSTVGQVRLKAPGSGLVGLYLADILEGHSSSPSIPAQPQVGL